jgi:hypothetical protein
VTEYVQKHPASKQFTKSSETEPVKRGSANPKLGRKKKKLQNTTKTAKSFPKCSRNNNLGIEGDSENPKMPQQVHVCQACKNLHKLLYRKEEERA